MSAEHPLDPLSKDTETPVEGVTIPEIEPSTPLEPRPSKSCKKGKLRTCLFLYIILGLIPLGMLGYFIYQSCQKLHSLSTKVSVLQNTYKEQSGSFLTGFNEYKAHNEQYNKSIQEQVAAQALQLHQLSDTHNWRISEANYLVAIAQERLNMVHDIPTAIKLLKTAEERLKNVGDVRTSRVREAIANDIHTLETKGRFDQIGVWVELGVLRKQVENLSFHTLQGNIEGQPEIVGAVEPVAIERAAWQRALENTWQELKGLVKVREFNADKLNSSLEVRDQILLLRAMDLMLIEAQWALLQEEPMVYQQSLERLEDKLNIYFVHDELWKKVNNELIVLKTKAIQPLNVDLSRTLTLLKALDSASASSQEEKVL